LVQCGSISCHWQSEQFLKVFQLCQIRNFSGCDPLLDQRADVNSDSVRQVLLRDDDVAERNLN
jgi:hypothetical protein